jgi:hypothetical protein
MRHAAEVHVSYYTMVVDNEDEAVSLSEYLNQHGVCAHKSDKNEVTCPVQHGTHSSDTIENLYKTWELFWDHSDSGLFGLPMYIKE